MSKIANILLRKPVPGISVAALLLSLFWSESLFSQTPPQLSELTLTISDTVMQQHVATDIAFEVSVVARDTVKNQVAVSGLELTVENLGNIVSLQNGRAAITFSGSPPVGTARIEVSLMRQGMNGRLGLNVANLPTGDNPELITGGSITIIAVPDYIDSVSLGLNHFGTPDQNDLNRSLANWFIDGTTLFSRIDRTEDSDTSGNRDPSRFLPQVDIEIRTFLFNGANGTRVFDSLFDNSFRRIRLQVTSGIGLGAELYRFNLISNEADMSDSSIELIRIEPDIGQYSLPYTDPGLSAWFTAPDSSAPRTATLTLSITGLPPSVQNNIVTSQEFKLIDQALNTITLSVIGETAAQPAPNAPVAVMLEVHTRGTFGFDYVKYLDLNLLVSASAEAMVSETAVTLNFSNNNPLQTTLMVTPAIFDTTLSITVEREGQAESATLIPDRGLSVPIRAARQLAGAELLLSEDTVQLYRIGQQTSVEINFQVRGYDQDGVLFSGTLIPVVTVSADGTGISISQSPLRLGEDGEANFTVTVTPSFENFLPLVITVNLDGLPAALLPPATEITIRPVVNTPTVIISVNERIEQRQPNKEIVFDVEVNIMDEEDTRISHPRLLLAVTAGANTVVSQRTWPVTFTLTADGQPSGTARIRANLIELNRDGSVNISIAGADNLALLSSRTVTLVAAEFRAYVAITLNPVDSFPAGTIENHYIFDNNRVDLSQSLPLRIFKRDNLEAFSQSRLSGNSNPNSSPREFRLNIQAYDATGQPLSLTPAPSGNITLEMTTGAGISSGSLYTSEPSSEALGQNTGLVYSPGQGFISSEFNSALTFAAALDEGVVSATMTLQINDLPNNLLPLQREITLIDQQLSTVTLTVDGEVPAQSTPGESVEVRLQVDTLGTLGYPFRKNLALNLITSTTGNVEDAEFAPIPLLNFNDDNPRQLTLRITPTGLADVSLTVLLDRLASGLSEEVALLPTGGLDLNVRAARQLARTELLLSGDTTQLRQSERQMPVEVDFLVRAFDQDGTPFNAMLIPTATASAAGAVIDIERLPLLLEEGTEATFTVTITPPAEFFSPFIVSVSLARLPPALQTPVVEITISPVIDTPTIIISVGEQIEQSRPNEEIVFDVEVNIWDVDGTRISRPGLQLTVTPDANTTVAQPTWPVTFSAGADGQFSGTARIRAGLIGFNQDGSVIIDITGADDLTLPPGRTVTLAAATFTAFVGITVNIIESIPEGNLEDHYIFDNNRVELPQPLPLRIFKRDNLEAFSQSRLSGNSNPNSSPREFRLNIQAYDATGQQLSLTPAPSGNISLEMTTGAGISSGSLYTSEPSSEALGQSTGLVYSPGQGFISSEFNSALTFATALDEGVVSATMTLQINGLPNNLLPLQREIVLIDQQLSTVTLTVDGEVPAQSTPGESVEVRLQVDTHGTLGYLFRKNLALNLITSTTGNVEDAEIEPIPLLNFSDDNPRQLTLRITPTGLADVSLTVLLNRLASGLSEEVALLPTGGLDLTVRAARQLVTVELRAVPETTEVRQVDVNLPVRISFEARGFDQHGSPAEGQLMATATSSVAGTVLAIEPNVLNFTAGMADFVLSVIPPAREPITVTLRLSGLPAGQREPAVEITIIPISSSEQLDLDEDNAVDLDELLLIQRWLETGRPDLTAGGATGAAGDENLAIEPVNAAGFNNLNALYSDGRMDVNNNGTVDEIDVRILFRYRAGLRGNALGVNVSEERIRLLLGISLP